MNPGYADPLARAARQERRCVEPGGGGATPSLWFGWSLAWLMTCAGKRKSGRVEMTRREPRETLLRRQHHQACQRPFSGLVAAKSRLAPRSGFGLVEPLVGVMLRARFGGWHPRPLARLDGGDIGPCRLSIAMLERAARSFAWVLCPCSWCPWPAGVPSLPAGGTPKRAARARTGAASLVSQGLLAEQRAGPATGVERLA